MPANPFDAPDLTPLGNVPNAGASAYQAFAGELLRRQQMQAMAEATARQQQKDELDRQLKQAQLDATVENQKSLMAERAANAQKAKADLVMKTTPTGPVSDEQAQAVRDAGLGGMLLMKPAQTMGVPSQFAAAPDAATAASGEVPTTPASTQFQTPASIEDDKRKAFAQKVLNGEYDTGDDYYDAPMKAQALQVLGGEKEFRTPPPKPQKDAAATMAQDNLAIEKTFYDKHIAAGMAPDEARVAARQDYNKLQGEEAGKRAATVVFSQRERQQAGFTNQAVQDDYKNLRSSFEKDISPRLDSAQKLVDTLNSPGGVNDVTAVPEFLSAMAGGIGHGLRMSQAELNMIQNARPTTETLEIKLRNLAGSYTALTPEQRAQMMALTKSVAAKEIALGNSYLQAMDDLQGEGMTAQKSHKIVAGLMRNQLGTAATALGLPAPAKKPAKSVDDYLKLYGPQGQ